MDKIIKLGLAALLLLCLADMPYGYFQVVRFLALIGFAILAFDANKNGKQTEVMLYIVMAILFQPLFKISLGRTLWNGIDVIVAIGLILSIFNTSYNLKKKG